MGHVGIGSCKGGVLYLAWEVRVVWDFIWCLFVWR